jgi:hypothetical protein
MPSFAERLHVVESIESVLYAHDIIERDQANIQNTELLFSMKMKSATEQRLMSLKISDVHWPLQ